MIIIKGIFPSWISSWLIFFVKGSWGFGRSLGTIWITKEWLENQLPPRNLLHLAGFVVLLFQSVSSVDGTSPFLYWAKWLTGSKSDTTRSMSLAVKRTKIGCWKSWTSIPANQLPLWRRLLGGFCYQGENLWPRPLLDPVLPVILTNLTSDSLTGSAKETLTNPKSSWHSQDLTWIRY